MLCSCHDSHFVLHQKHSLSHPTLIFCDRVENSVLQPKPSLDWYDLRISGVMKVLCVAEKPSISKAVTEILSGGEFTTRQSTVPWIKNYDFSYRQNGPGHVQFTMTCVAGHLMDTTFPKEYSKWNSVDPYALFDAPIERFVQGANAKIARNLESEARQADEVMIWTDCDREGEHIGSEIVAICQKVKRNIRVSRARFSAIIAAQIHHACRNPVQLDMLQAAAVSVRMDLDLRVGAALTRLQTLALQPRFPTLDSMVVSYGPCQFPTLGFVVDQYERLQNFVAESFWYIDVSLEREGQSVKFAWKRHRLFDEFMAFLLYEMCIDQPEATVTAVQTKPTSKWKPLPLTTVELQKAGSRLLHLTPKKVLDIAEKLYQKGFVSYPRTETDQYDKDFNFVELIEKQTTDGSWGGFATRLKDGEFERPRNGRKNDQAHPPIHPTSHASNLAADEKKVYEFITRRFLASCSKNATGRLTTIEAEIAGEAFSASGLVILQRNYLEVYPYDKWQGSHVPDFQVGERFMPSVCELQTGETSPPKLLTEADLVNLMDKNGIGTDATIAEHIHKIIEREYVMKRREGTTEYLLPSTLGIGLIEGYGRIGLEKSLSKPHLRRETELQMTRVCDGTRSKQHVLNESLDQYRHVFLTTKQQFQHVIDSVGKYLNGQHAGDGSDNDHAYDDDGAPHSDGNDDGSNGDGGPGGSPRGPPRGRGGRASSTRARGGARGRGTGGRSSGPPPRPPSRKPPDEDDAPLPDCTCGIPSIRLTVKKLDSPHVGRLFFKCSKPQGEQCQFFQFVDEAPGASNDQQRKRPLAEQQASERSTRLRFEGPPARGTGTNEPVRCYCKLEAERNVSHKENANKGKGFYVCSKVSNKSKCNFFQWDDAEPAAAPPVAGPSGSFTCFKCGAEGHFSTSCPNGYQTKRRPTSRRGRSSYKSRGRGRGRGRGRAG